MSDLNRQMHQVADTYLASEIFKESVVSLIVHGRRDQIPHVKPDEDFDERCKRLAELSLRASLIFEDTCVEVVVAKINRLAAARAAREANAQGVEA